MCSQFVEHDSCRNARRPSFGFEVLRSEARCEPLSGLGVALAESFVVRESRIIKVHPHRQRVERDVTEYRPKQCGPRHIDGEPADLVGCWDVRGMNLLRRRSVDLHSVHVQSNNCAVIAPPGKKLVSSVVTLGDHPVPFG
jgi:hypothetical protein